MTLTKRTLRGNRSHPTTPIPKLRRNSQFTLITNTHIQQTLIPTLDNLTPTHGEFERLAPIVRRIELATVRRQRASVVHVDRVTPLRLACAVFRDEVLCFHDRGGGGGGEGEEGEEDAEEVHFFFVVVDVVVVALCLIGELALFFERGSELGRVVQLLEVRML